MFGNLDGAKEITIKDIEDFLNSDGAVSPAADESVQKADDVSNESPPATQPDSGSENNKDTTKITETQAFARRLREETNKIRREERDNIAKSLGYENYAALQKAREADLLKENGLDPEEVAPIVEQIVNKRLAEDPRLKEFEAYRQQKVNEWAQKELVELKDLTGGKISKIEDVPKDVLELWKTKGSLKAAYLELKGEELIRELRISAASEQSKGSTGHLKTLSGAAPVIEEGKRPFTEQEKEIYKLFNPEVTDEQLSKMFKQK